MPDAARPVFTLKVTEPNIEFVVQQKSTRPLAEEDHAAMSAYDRFAIPGPPFPAATASKNQ